MEIRKATSLTPFVSKETYAQLRRRLEQVIRWLTNSIPGMTDQKLRSTRIYYYKNQIEKIETLFKQRRLEHLPNRDFVNYIRASHDAHLFCDIHREFRGRKDKEFIKLLELVVDGTPQASDEKNSKARDTLFELRLAGMFGSSNVSFEVEDFVVRVGDKRIGVECKRLKANSAQAIERNFKKATKQLTQKMNAGNIDYGIVGFQIDKMFNPGDKAILSQNIDELGRHASMYIDSFIGEYRPIFLKNVDIRIVGVLAVLIGPAITDREKMPFYVVQSGANNLSISEDSVAENLKHYIDPRHQVFKDVVKMLTPRKF